MTRLSLSDTLILKGERYSWTLCEIKRHKSGKQQDEPYDYDISYHANLRQALARGLDEYIKRSDATDWTQVIAAIDEFGERLSEALQPRVSVKLDQLLED